MRSKGIIAGFVLAWLLPVCAFGYTVSLHYGWQPDQVRMSEHGGFDYLGVDGAIFADGTIGQVYDMRLIPQGYRVKSYRVVAEHFEYYGYEVFVEDDRCYKAVGVKPSVPFKRD